MRACCCTLEGAEGSPASRENFSILAFLSAGGAVHTATGGAFAGV